MKKIIALFILVFIVSAVSAKTENTKKLFAAGNIKKNMKKVVEWQLKNPNHELTDWTNGAFYAGVSAAWETTKSKTIWQAMVDMGNKNGWKPGKRWYHADDIAICQTYIDVYKVEKKKEMIQTDISSIIFI